MKIAFLNLYSGVDNRGGETFAHGLASRLARRHDVWFYSGDKINQAAFKNVIIPSWLSRPSERFTNNFSLSLPKRLFLDPGALSVLFFSLRLFSRLWKEKFDILVPLNGFWQVLICKIVIILRGGKILITGHSGPGWDERWNLYLKPDVFVATTEPTAVWARKIAPWTRVEVIPYGVDIERFQNANGVKLDLERPIILCPAAAVSYKRVDLAIEAMAKLRKGSLLHLGKGSMKGELEVMGEKILGSRRFASLSVLQDEIPGYYAACDLVTLPSEPQENSPMVFLEAMAAGKFVVATDTPRNRWILGETGLYVDPKDINTYAGKIEEGLRRKDAKVIEVQVRKYFWRNISKNYEQLLNGI